MKLKTTKKDIKEGYYRIIGIGYCSLQHALNYVTPFAYSTRAEGWACDYYDIDGVCISTGYAPLASKNAKVNYDLVNEYDIKAMKIAGNGKPYEVRKAAMLRLLRKFVAECTKTEGGQNNG